MWYFSHHKLRLPSVQYFRFNMSNTWSWFVTRKYPSATLNVLMLPFLIICNISRFCCCRVGCCSMCCLWRREMHPSLYRRSIRFWRSRFDPVTSLWRSNSSVGVSRWMSSSDDFDSSFSASSLIGIRRSVVSSPGGASFLLLAPMYSPVVSSDGCFDLVPASLLPSVVPDPSPLFFSFHLSSDKTYISIFLTMAVPHLIMLILGVSFRGQTSSNDCVPRGHNLSSTSSKIKWNVYQIICHSMFEMQK